MAKKRLLNPEYEIRDGDKVFIQNSDVTNSYALVFYDPELCAYLLLYFTDKHFEDPLVEGPDKSKPGKTDFVYAVGLDLLERVEDYDIDELD